MLPLLLPEIIAQEERQLLQRGIVPWTTHTKPAESWDRKDMGI
jgi:hypothetical protein